MSRSVLGGALVATLVLGCASPAAANPRPAPSRELGACRLLATSYTPGRANGTRRTQLANEAVERFFGSTDVRLGTILAPLRHGDVPDLGAELGAWCRAHFPKDSIVRHARFPRVTTTTTRTQPRSRRRP